MANEVKNISINTFEKCVSELMPTNMIVTWHDIDVIVKNRLGLKDMLQFIDDVVKLCFSDNGEYMPEVRDFAVKCKILEVYANFRLPENGEKRYDLVFACDIYPLIMNAIDRRQFDTMMRAIDEKIDNIAQANIEMIKKKMDEYIVSFENLEERISELFAGIDNDSIVNLVGAMSNMNIDENGLVKAYFKEKETSTNVVQEVVE